MNKMIQKSASGISNDPEIDDLIVEIKRRISTTNHKRGDVQPELNALKQGSKHNKKPNKIRDSSHTKATQNEDIYALQYEFGIVDKMGNQKTPTAVADFNAGEYEFILSTIEKLREKDKSIGANIGKYYYNGIQIYPKEGDNETAQKTRSVSFADIKAKQETASKAMPIEEHYAKLDEMTEVVREIVHRPKSYNHTDFVKVEWGIYALVDLFFVY